MRASPMAYTQAGLSRNAGNSILIKWDNSQILDPLAFAQSRFSLCLGRAHTPKTSLSVRAVESIDCALARSSALFFGVEKPWPVPL